MRVQMVFISVLLLSAMLPGCGSYVPPTVGTAKADIVDSDGTNLGMATLMETTKGATLNFDISGLKPGSYSLQVRDKGVCEPPHFDTAGALMETSDEPQAEPAGNLGDFEVGKDGKASVNRTLTGVSLFGNDHSLLNKSLVITADSGIGARVACGVIKHAKVNPYRYATP